MADQEHVGVVDGQRVVHRDLPLLLGRTRRGPVGQVGGELVRHPGLATLADEGHREVVDGEVERVELGRVEQGAGPEVVVLAQRVGEAVLGHHDHAALEAPQATDGEADEHDQHRDVEQQVARLPQVAALRRRGRRCSVSTRKCLRLSQACARSSATLGGLVGLEAAVLRHPGQVPWCPRRPVLVRRASRRASGAGSSPPARSSAGCRSRRTTPSRRPRTARAARRSASAWGAGRATARHAASRPPPAAPPSPGIEASASRNSRIRAVRIEVSCRQTHRASSSGPMAVGVGRGSVFSPGHQTPVSKPGKNQPRIQSTSTPHQPVTSSSPTAISITPPSAVTHCWWRRTHPTVPSMWR